MNAGKNVGMIIGLIALVSLMVPSMGFADSGEGHHPHGNMPHGSMTHRGGGYGGGAHEGGMEGHHGGMSPLNLKESLGLSDDQESRLRPIEMEYRKAMIQNGADLRVAMIDLGNMLDAKETDKAAIGKKVDEIGALQKKMMMYRVDVLIKVKGILSQDQYEQYRAKLRSRMEGMSHHMGGMMKEGVEHHEQYPGKHHGE